MDTKTEMLVTQTIALGWFRCLMEEGYDFVNKLTGEIETNEVMLYRHFQQNSGAFDLPSAKCSPTGLEKNLLEVIGNLVVNNDNPDIAVLVQSSDFKKAIKTRIEKIRSREYSGKVPS